MGQRGVHATITKDEKTGLITVNHVTVQWSLNIADIIQFALQHADKDGYSQDEFLNLLKKTVADMEHIGAFDLLDEDYPYYADYEPMEGYCIVARNHEDGKEYRLGIRKGSGSLLTSYKESDRYSTPRAFAKRKAAEKFIKEHGHAQDAVSYLWDLDTNQFTFFVNKDWGGLKAYDFATGEIVTCKEITYSLDQLRHPNASVENLFVEYDGNMSSDLIVPLYTGALPEEAPAEEESEFDIAMRAYQRLPLQWPGGNTPTHARIALLNRSAAQYAAVVCAEGKEFPANLLTVNQTLEGRVIDRNPFVYDPHNEAQPAYVVTDFSGNPQIGSGEWEFSKISSKTGRVDLSRTYKVTGNLEENTLDELFNKAVKGGAHKPDAYYGRKPVWLADLIRDVSTGPWTLGDVEYWSKRCDVPFDYETQMPDTPEGLQEAFEQSATKYADAMKPDLVAFPKGKPVNKRLDEIQRRWLLGFAGRSVMPDEIELSPVADGKFVEAYVKSWERSLVIPMGDALDKLVYRALAAAVYDYAGNRNAPLTNLRLTAKDSEAIMCAAFSPAWSASKRLNNRQAVIKLSDWIAKH